VRNLRTIEVPGNGPEDTLFDTHGNVYCSLRDNGLIVRVDVSRATTPVVADTGGAPLGLEWLPDGRMLVCNADKGLQAVDLNTGSVEQMPCDMTLQVCNNASVLQDGTILVSDSSACYPLADYQKDIVENTTSGRLIRVAVDGRCSVLLDQLSFANGVVAVGDGNAIDSVLVAETGTGVIARVPLDGGERRVFAETPGHPDNMSIGTDGNIWVAVPSLPSKPVALLHRSPMLLRKAASRLPPMLQPKPELCCRVAVYDSTGNLLRVDNGDTSAFSLVTGVREHHGIVALGSIEHNCIALYDSA
jgi:sugar lactone lactonase YvrE